MKKKWIAGCAASAFFLSATAAFWMEKPALTQQLSEIVTTTANSKLNGTLSFASMDISLTGKVTISRPVIHDAKGRIVLESEDIDVYVNPVKILPSLWDGNVLASLDTVAVDKPVVHLWENEDGSWNVAALIKPSDTERGADFYGVVRLSDGVVRVLLPDGSGRTVALEDVDGSVSFAEYPKAIALTADASLDGYDLILSGTYTSARQYDMTIQAERIDASYAAPFIPKDVDVTILGGAAENVKARVADGKDGLFVSGQADIADGAAAAYGLSVDGLTGHVSLGTDDVLLKGVSGTINGQEFQADGIVKTNGASPVFNIDVDVPGAALDAFSEFIPAPVSGTVGFKGTLWGTADDVSGKGKLTASNVAYDGWLLDDGAADISYADHVAQIENLTAHAAGGEITGRGAYHADTGDFTAEAKAASVDLSQIPAVPVSVLGSVSAEVQAAGNLQSGTVQALGRAEAYGLSYNGIESDRSSADFSYTDGVITLSNLDMAVGGGTIRGGGTYDMHTGAPNIAFTAENVSLDVLSSAASVPMSGSVSAAGHVYGPDLQWELSVSGRNGSIQHLAFDSIDGTLRGVGRQIEIPAAYWRYKDGVHTLSGTVDLDTRAVSGTMTTEHMRLEKLLPAIGQGDLPMTGWADNTVSIRGTIDDPVAEGTFHLTSGSYAGYLYKNISADYRLDQGVLYISNGDISSYNASVSVQGSVGQSLNLDIEGKELDISRMMPRSRLPRSGVFNVSAHIGGTPDNPTAGGSLRADTLTINGMELTNVRGDFAYYDKLVRLTDLHFDQSGGSYDANLLYRTEDGWMRGQTGVRNGDIASILKLAAVPVQQVEGHINGQIDLEGTSSDPKASITGQITDASLAGQAVEPADIDIRLEKGTVQVNKLALKTGDSLLAAKGTYAFHGPVDMQVAARNFPSRILLDILGQTDVAVDTPIDFAAALGGTGDDLEADVSAQLNGGAINGVSFTNGFALLNIRDGNIHIDQAYLARDPYKVAAYGDIPVSALHGGRGAEPMNVTLKLDNTGLDILAVLTPAVESAQGGVEGELQLGGTLAEPQINGSVSVQDGSIQFSDVTYPLEHITGNIVFGGQNVSVTASATMDKEGAKDPGSVFVQGQAAWDGWHLTKYEGNLFLNRLALDCDYFKGPLNGTFTLGEGRRGPKLSGSIDIANTTLDIPLSFSDSSSAPELELDVSVNLGEKVRLYNPALYDLMVNGSARFRGSTTWPMPSGRFEASRGTVYYLNTTFRLSKARADFNQFGSFLPSVDIEGNTRVGQYGVLLTLRGPVENMDLVLRSDPPLTKQQIISLITLRNSSSKQQSSLNSEDMSTLVGSGIRMTLNSLGITQELEKALYLDMLTVTNGSLDFSDKHSDVSNNYYNIEMGKYLFDNFMLTAAFGLNHDDNRFGAQYDLGSRFNVNAWTSDDDSFVGGMYRYSFY